MDELLTCRTIGCAGSGSLTARPDNESRSSPRASRRGHNSRSPETGRRRCPARCWSGTRGRQRHRPVAAVNKQLVHYLGFEPYFKNFDWPLQKCSKSISWNTMFAGYKYLLATNIVTTVDPALILKLGRSLRVTRCFIVISPSWSRRLLTMRCLSEPGMAPRKATHTTRQGGFDVTCMMDMAWYY